MLANLLQALRGYFDETDDPTPGPTWLGTPDLPLRNMNRLWRLYARTLVELAKATRDTNQQVQQNTQDIAAIKERLEL